MPRSQWNRLLTRIFGNKKAASVARGARNVRLHVEPLEERLTPAEAVHIGSVPYIGNSYPYPVTVGYRFGPTATVVTNQLGVYDYGGDGISGSAQVGLWNDSGGLLVLLR
jgi:hypothetical protein